MRLGENPHKDKKIDSGYYHRVIIPVHVPELEGYYENGLKVTRICLNSLIKTIHSGACITVVDNGSCQEVKDYLLTLFQDGKLDQLILNSVNQGKIDAVIPVARTSAEQLITISDGDVLFMDGWIQEVETVFLSFPEAGMVSPVPHGTTAYNYTVNTLFDGMFKGRLKYQQLCDQEDMMRFARSIGKEDSMYKDRGKLHQQLTVIRSGHSAVVGCGHFVSTIRKEVFDHSPKERSQMAYASIADRTYIDIPVEHAMYWRLATVKNCAYHMGNHPEPWMEELFDDLSGNRSELIQVPSGKRWNVPLEIKRIMVRLLYDNRLMRPLVNKRLGYKSDWS
ncbi:glycosyltransferase family A protein [Aureitalea marina]|uniref:Glycosyltransferase 2-like domain-containing protein n=1 Tax=Aureitalea marina TaxID=930804 RepID=A0A2S7KMM5_9FLAO|nr:glycosyltransferase family A protein [Aureitalea marina]PQB03885.1 hypothetical protein BST85_02410 [Aureitalea marina]